jgi:DNA-binding transcriptional ArsR family regulator
MGETARIAPASVGGADYDVQAGTPEALSVSVALDPHQSVLSLLLQAASGRSFGASPGLLAAVRHALRPQARFAARWFAADGLTIPDCCSPIPPLADTSVGAQVARLREMPGAALIDELEAADDSNHWPPHWRAAAEQPRRWLNSMADAALDTWAVAEPRWRAAGPLLDREIRRVGTAAVRGGTAALLNSLHPGLSFHAGDFVFTSPCDPSFTVALGPIGTRRLVLVPMVAGRDALWFSFDRPDLCYIAYPIYPRRPGPQAVAESALATILGPVRAAILQALRQPLTVNAVAAAVHCAPTTATYHLHQLAGSGLIRREKSGSSIWVRRTSRGDDLVELLSD